MASQHVGAGGEDLNLWNIVGRMFDKAAANLNMLVRTKGGRQYSVAELSGLLAGCGFRDVRVVPAAAYFSLASSKKPGDPAR